MSGRDLSLVPTPTLLDLQSQPSAALTSGAAGYNMPQPERDSQELAETFGVPRRDSAWIHVSHSRAFPFTFLRPKAKMEKCGDYPWSLEVDVL